MISDALVRLIDENFDNLTAGVNLFSEKGILGNCVYVKTSTYPVGNVATNVRKTNARVFIKGYVISEAVKIGEDLLEFLDAFRGEIHNNDNRYSIRGIDILSAPTIISDDDKLVGFNANIYYVYIK